MRKSPSAHTLQKSVVIIGTSHPYQIPGARGALEFSQFVANALGSNNFSAVGEEMSLEALSESNASFSVCQTIATKLGIRHVYCDPDSTKRERLDMLGESEARRRAFFVHNLSRPQTDAYVQASRDRREFYWIQEIVSLDSWPLLFICGAKHVHTISEKLISLAIQATILKADWEPGCQPGT